MEDPMEDTENPNWDLIKSMAGNNKKDYKEYICNTCKTKFISPRYLGKTPLCNKHRLRNN
jgi:hypothetical protein